MDSQEMSRTQRFFTRFAGAGTAAAIEAHSRAWLASCPGCGFERSIWELGGIRYKAAGNPRMLVRCSKCGSRGWHKVHKAASFPRTSVPAWPLVRLILAAVLVAFLVIGLIVGLALKLTGAI